MKLSRHWLKKALHSKAKRAVMLNTQMGMVIVGKRVDENNTSMGKT